MIVVNSGHSASSLDDHQDRAVGACRGGDGGELAEGIDELTAHRFRSTAPIWLLSSAITTADSADESKYAGMLASRPLGLSKLIVHGLMEFSPGCRHDGHRALWAICCGVCPNLIGASDSCVLRRGQHAVAVAVVANFGAVMHLRHQSRRRGCVPCGC